MMLTSPPRNKTWVFPVATLRAFKTVKPQNGYKNYRNVAMTDFHSLKSDKWRETFGELNFLNKPAALVLPEQVLAL